MWEALSGRFCPPPAISRKMLPTMSTNQDLRILFGCVLGHGQRDGSELQQTKCSAKDADALAWNNLATSPVENTTPQPRTLATPHQGCPKRGGAGGACIHSRRAQARPGVEKALARG